MKVNRKYGWLIICFFILLITIIIDITFGLIFIPHDSNSFRIYHPYYHHDLKANVNTMTTWDNVNEYTFITNSLGFRDSINRSVDTTTNKYRFLIIGDSHTEGVGVEYQQTFSGYFAKSLKRGKYDVLNAGVVSYSPKLYYLKVKYLSDQLGLKFNHLIVFIDISDIQNELAYEDFTPSEQTPLDVKLYQLKKWANRTSLIYYSLNVYKDHHRQKKFYELMGKQNRNPKTDIYSNFFSDFKDSDLLRDQAFHNIGLWYLDKNLFEKWGKKGLDLESFYMQKLVNLCKKREIHLSISVHPWPIQIKYGDENNLQVNYWKEFCNKNGIGFINHYQVFLDLNKTEDVISKYYLPGDVHWNEQGHWIAADNLIKHLEDYYH